jgi:hypothetical protein
MLRKRNRLTVVLLVFFATSILFVGCKEEKANKKSSKFDLEEFESPKFSADSAYGFIEKQLSFGYRIPGTDAHKACKDWMVSKFSAYGANVKVQEFKSDFLTVKGAESFNIIASFNPSATKRILLAAHWDSRLIAEKDTDASKKSKPIMGADDGASGTSALIELARIINERALTYIGVDIVLFDVEDQGIEGSNWCLGSQYWSRNPHVDGYFAEYGVLLDMVGAKGAQFGYEGISEANAKNVLYKVWNLARHLGYSDLFVPEKRGPVTDDHYYVMMNRGFPMIDIINMPSDGKDSYGFGHYHHTHKDDIEIIDKEVLGKVGDVMSQLIYREDSGKI